jgi:putative membrane protein
MRHLSATIAVAMICGTAFAAGDKLAHGDRKFIEKAAEGGMSEVNEGQLAATKASDAAVKSYATMLVDDHTKANQELSQIAGAKKVELPAAPSHAMRRDAEKLAKKTGMDFDRTFIDHAVKDHKKTIKDFEKEARDSKDADLKAFAQKTLPVLQKHLAEAQKVQASLNAAAMGNKGK